MVATATDCLRFCQMLLNGGVFDDVGILGAGTVAHMTSDHLGPIYPGSTVATTSCSWANAVETFFASLTRGRLQRGAFHSLVYPRPPSTDTSAGTTANPS